MKKNSLEKAAFLEARKKFTIVSLPLSFFALFTIGVLVLGFYFPFSLILTIPFIVIPAFFAVSAINIVAPNKNTHEGLGFFVMFRAYFTHIFRGGYKVVIGFLKSLLTFILSAVILSAILSSTILYKDPQYIELMNKINTMADTNAITEALNNFMNTNVTFNNLMIIIYIVSIFLALFMFIHHFAVNSIKYNYNFLSSLPLPMQDLNLIFTTVLRQNRRKFYKMYYKAFWFLGIALAMGYAGGALIAYFFINNIDMVQMSVIGIFGAFIVLLFFIPYFLNASQFIFMEFRPQYVDTLIDLSKKSLEEIKKVQGISEEKEKEVLSILESQKDDPNKENKDNDKSN